MYQQGDVIIESAVIPAGAKETKRKVLAEGEVTGHAHRVTGDARLFELGDRLLMRIGQGNAKVIHEEHKEITIPPGDYEVRKVIEYDHFAEEAREVQD